MDWQRAELRGKSTAAGASVLHDPLSVILPWSDEPPPSRKNQRLRRAQIFATIRRLLTEHGLEGVTMRRIAEGSGVAVQTIYNLAGPRDEAIIEAISEYTRHVGLTAVPDTDDPNALLKVIDGWVQSIEDAPEFCRQVCLIFFTPSRGIFYHFRDRQFKAMKAFLARQHKAGLLRPDTNTPQLAQQMIIFASALCVEWSDRPFPLELLRKGLQSGFGKLLAGSSALGGGCPWRSIE